MKGTTIQYADNDLNNAVKKIIISLFEKKCIDAVLAPKRVPAGESFAYELANSAQGAADLHPFPPVIPINGARALTRLTRRGSLSLKILCVMRPCEIRGCMELAKLRQVDLTNIAFLSLDCPGALPTRDYIADPKKCDASFTQALKTYQIDAARPACGTCVHFESTGLTCDLHIAKIGLPDNALMVIPCSQTGEAYLNAVALSPRDDASTWHAKTEEQRAIRKEQRKKAFAAIANRTAGIDDLEVFFADCINCHNCMRVCPICYCRQCLFDSSDATRIEAENYLLRADKKGGIALPADKLFFHLGRMFHMGLSCIGCGACEDACATAVPVAQIFNYMGDKIQQAFNYIPGRNADEQIPVLTYKEDELHEYEDAKAIP